MGILLVYDVTDESSFNNIRNWMRNIEQHASDNVNKVICTAIPVQNPQRLLLLVTLHRELLCGWSHCLQSFVARTWDLVHL